jgi:hypothetical protein
VGAVVVVLALAGCSVFVPEATDSEWSKAEKREIRTDCVDDAMEFGLSGQDAVNLCGCLVSEVTHPDRGLSPGELNDMTDDEFTDWIKEHASDCPAAVLGDGV